MFYTNLCIYKMIANILFLLKFVSFHSKFIKRILTFSLILSTNYNKQDYIKTLLNECNLIVFVM